MTLDDKIENKTTNTVFTFGEGQPFAKHYVHFVHPTHIDVRNLMSRYFGGCWAFEYCNSSEPPDNNLHAYKPLLRVIVHGPGMEQFQIMPEGMRTVL